MIQFQEYLQSDYPGFASFIDTIIKPIFGDNFKAVTNIDDMIDCLKEDPEELEYYDEIAKSTDESLKLLAEESGLERVLKLGTIQVQGDTRPIYVYDITVSKRRQLSRNRKGIQQLIARTLNNQSGAFMLFHYGDADWEWRFSYKFVGKDKEDATNSKRYTYLLGRDQVCKTAAQRFTNLLNKKGKIAFDDITDAFSVEKVSKEFFDHYRSIYADIICYVTGKRMVKVGSKWEEKQEHEPNEFIMQQFAQFSEPEKSVRDYVKKLMGRLVFLQFIQKKGWLGVPADDDTWTKGDKDFVQNLFAHCEDKDTFIDDILEPLFEDINNRREGDIANAILGKDIKIPYLNGGLFEQDAEDKTFFPLPEKYFWNNSIDWEQHPGILQFFTAYNFTIDENDPDDAEVGVDPEMLGRVFENLLEDNKDKGAFYTPKEIVQYMCRESLIAYLQTDLEDSEIKNSIREFVSTHDISVLKSSEVFNVDKKLREVKICDPAIGSGAFPMGLLKELFDCRMAIEGSEEGKTPADIKKDIIQNSIYGVDIEKGAVDIARLRFWLSLIIDEQTPHALPNMDFKIMQGNSLLEQYEGVDLSGITLNDQAKERAKTKKQNVYQQVISFDEKDAMRKIQNGIKQYFITDNHAMKEALRGEINEGVREYIYNLKDCTPDIQTKIEKLPIPNDQFFLWHIYFKDVFDKGGFDIVIGNPPYGAEFSESEKKLIREKYKSYKYKYESYVYFIELGLYLLKDKGVLEYITPTLWLSLENNYPLRQIISTNDLISLFIHGDNIFEAAVVNTCSFTIKKQPSSELIAISRNTNETIFEYKSDIINPETLQIDYRVNTAQRRIIKKIQNISTPLFKYGVTIQGITPYDKQRGQSEALIKSRAFHSTKCENETYGHWIDGKDLSRYYLTWGGIWLSYGEWLAAPREPRFFQGPRLLFREIPGKDKRIQATYCDSICYYGHSISPFKAYSSYENDYKFFLGVVNSKILSWYGALLLPNLGKEIFPKLNPKDISLLPIPKCDNKKWIEDIVDQILSLKKENPQANTTALEHEIDLLVYDLYGLTPEEIAIVEGTNNA